VYNPVEDMNMTVEGVIPIAGNYETTNGKGLEPKFSRLKSKDTQTEGLLMELHGGQFNKKNQMAIIEFQCDLDRSGNEGFEAADGKIISTRAAGLLDKREVVAMNIGSLTKEDPKDDSEDDGKSLSFVSYGSTDEKTDLLRLNWRTKYACEDFEDDDGGSSSKNSHWGFFTWFIIMWVSWSFSPSAVTDYFTVLSLE
jgi:autophagy-related protein 27